MASLAMIPSQHSCGRNFPEWNISAKIRRKPSAYITPDFSNWKNHDAFERAFARLENDLRTRLGK